MCIVELNRKSNHLVLSQTLFTEVVHLDDFDIGKVYTGLVYAIDSTYIKLYLQGIVGWLPAEQRLPDQDVLLDLRNTVHIGQEIGVRVTKKRERSLWLVLESLSSEG